MFCKEYLIDLNATQAAVRAGYSQKTANKIGPENLVKLGIRNEIKRLMSKRSERVKMSADDVLNDIADIIDANKKIDAKTALKGLELYGKHLKLFTDKIEHSGEINIPQINIKRGE